MSHRIFVSYSRRDAALIAPIVKLLRGTNDWVFLDSDNIQTGKKWRDEIDTALSTSTLVVVFWCQHAKSSAEIRKEYRAAVNARKDIIPVLLDSTLPPRALAQYQWLDFRSFVEGKHDKTRDSGNLHSIAIPFLVVGAIAAWLTKTGWSPFSETTTIFVLLGFLLAGSYSILGIHAWLKARRRRALVLIPGTIGFLEAMIRGRLETTEPRHT